MLTRQFAIPNPFEALGEGLLIHVKEVSFLLPPDLLNLMAEPMIHFITFALVGLYYSKDDEAAWGSTLYMLFYCIHIGLLYLILSLYPATWIMIAVIILYVAAHIGFNELKNRPS